MQQKYSQLNKNNQKRHSVFWCRSFLYRMRSFYTLKLQANRFLQDIKWLKREWCSVQAHPVEPFSSETKTNGILHSEAAKMHDMLAADVLQKYSTLSLMTELKTKSGEGVVKFCDVVSGFSTRWITERRRD
ncbi:hypothetical protein F441_22047 [Phytophthora nicotianae CJ01A1]|uniref:Uncharacterized protein n=1 Tax=Phytophthora nicotianae CJ01A1 TaxID=1317063 RepID=W2VQN4_PHYNI|nr:hypothetical protein F441_22047 [Phytophthora nicotianae CJ01A1]